MSRDLLDKEAVESLAERQTGCESDPRIVAFNAIAEANRLVLESEAELRAMQAAHSNELRDLWDSLVPPSAEYLELRSQIANELAIAELYVDHDEALAEIESRYAEACNLAWSLHADRYHEPAREHMRAKYSEQQLIEDKLRDRLKSLRKEEARAHEALKRLLPQAA